MTWTHAHTGSYLTHDQTGAQKPKPTLWLPHDRKLYIPEGAQDHARPIVVLQGDETTVSFTLMLYQRQIMGQYQSNRKVLVEL